MNKLTLFRTLVLSASAAASLCLFATVASAAAVITNWQDPVPYSFVSFNSPVLINGSYTLPPNWVGTIYVIQDGVQLPQELTVDNLGGSSPKIAAFSINLGIQPPLPNPHSIQLEFFGGTQCYIEGTCAGTVSNNADEYTVPRNYTASGSPDPVLWLSYDAAGTQPISSPALNFSNTVVNTPSHKIIYVRNVGDGVATGVASISSGNGSFSCATNPTCAYSLAAGAPAVPIDIQYYPMIAPSTDSGVLNFSCAPNCAGVNAGITGSSVAQPLPPRIDVEPAGFWFNTVNIGTPVPDKIMAITNTGGGILAGNLDTGGADFSCPRNPTCAFSVAASDSVNIPIRFTPTTPGNKDRAGHVNSNATNYPSVSIWLSGYGNNQPLQDITCIGCVGQYDWDVGQIAIGSTLNVDVEITNIGVGVVAGYLDPTPGTWTTHGWSCTSVTEPDGTVVTPLPNQPCQYYGVTHSGNPAVAHMSYTALSPSGPVTDSVNFKNTANPGNDNLLSLHADVILGQLNIGAGHNINIGNWLVSNAEHAVSPKEYTVNFTNQGGAPAVVTLALPTGAGVYTCDIAGTPCLLDTPNSIVFAGNETKILTIYFDPTNPVSYQQLFTVCLGVVDCVEYTLNGYGQDPHLSILPLIPGSADQDKWVICATESNPCTFSGTKKVYYGNNIGMVSINNFVGGSICSVGTFGSDPAPGYPKYCWYANPDGGTWTNAPFTSKMIYKITNDGTGGRMYYQILKPAGTHFVCETPLSGCIGWNTLPSGFSSDNYDVDHDNIYFNPSTAGLISETVTVQYHYTADPNSTVTDCPGGVAQYCHSVSFTHTGTGLTGPKIGTSVGTFPLTNVGATTNTTLTVTNTGTDPVTNVSIGDGSGPFHCVANCTAASLIPLTPLVATISYTATAGGLETGSLLISSSELPQVTVPVSGTGNTLPQIEITPGSPGFLDYGTVNEGSQAISGDGVIAAIKVKNIGAAPLSGDATITIGGKDFKCVSCHYGPLLPGEEVEIKIAFAPTDVIALSGVVSFSGGGGASLQLFGIGQLGASSFTSADANFGRVLIKAGNYREQVVTIFNNGSVAIPAGTISFAGTANGMFTCVPPTPMNGSGQCTYPIIPPNGGTVSFTIRFTPTSPGAKSDKIRFSGSANAKVTITGIGVIPSVKFKER